MPGPLIAVNTGDVVRVLVRNQLTETPTNKRHLSMHFHGIRQYGSLDADGVPYLTQRPIAPGEEYLHEFRVINQAGTHFYHAHVGMQESTLFGPIIIYESEEANPENLSQNKNKTTTVKGQANLSSNQTLSKLTAGPYTYDEERLILLSEWWQRTQQDFEHYLVGPNYAGIPDAETILLNGRGIRDSNNILDFTCNGYETILVEPSKTYRLRVIGSTAFRTLGFSIADHVMTIIEVDGELTKPYNTTLLEVAPGQRFSVLLRTNQVPDSYGIQVVRRWSEEIKRPTNGLAVLRYVTNSTSTNKTIFTENDTSNVESRGTLQLITEPVKQPPALLPTFPGPEKEVPNWIWSDIEPLYGVDPVVYRSPSRTIKLRAVDKLQPDNGVRWYVNDVSFMEEGGDKKPILEQIMEDIRPNIDAANATLPNGYNPILGTYPVENFEIIDLVFQSTYEPGKPCRSHPWHTHGHSHYFIASGAGEYVEHIHGQIRNIKTPVARDITMVYPHIDPELTALSIKDNVTHVGCGWSKVRLIADNPGIWAVHCHNTAHMLMGMMVVLEESPELISKANFREE
ncbi:L-ascorbate oxidase [Choanephora cucurbitarum]|uniref:L-ascorbate oxidase n=1 Tax=Choanephora cucurbitarum TaxID=101091 RepID=A0A1C7N9V5_9FUNG|nr:L-ascorbate oxidase [Choanephora cucurbitarum]